MKVVCIGSGYVGSVTAAAFAALGHKTTVIDVDKKKVDLLNAGKSPIYEPGLEEIIQRHIGVTLFAATSYEAVRDAEVVFIAVGTPSREDGTADLKYVKKASVSIGNNLNPNSFTVVIDKSTVPVGTADLVSTVIEEASGLIPEKHYSVVSNPEFLREGFALEDVFFPDRIVVGSDNDRARERMKHLYAAFVDRIRYEEICEIGSIPYKKSRPKPQYFETDTKSAEMIKYVSNAFLAVKISYINEVAKLCEVLGANVLDVAMGMGMDSRIGEKFLEVSSGWSGSCFPKDTAELLASSQKFGCELAVVSAAVEANLQMHRYVVEKVKRQLTSLYGKNVGILGLTFKPDTDDARKTQASAIIRELIEHGAHVKVHDPRGMENFKKMNEDLEIQFCPDPEIVTKNTDALILLTHWKEYKNLNWKHIYRSMREPYILDTRNYLDRSLLVEEGFRYEGLGIGENTGRQKLSFTEAV